MPVYYYLKPNAVTPDPKDQSARVLPKESLDYDAIVKLMLQRGSMAGEADIRAVTLLFMQVIADEVANGNFVNLPLVNIRSGISGVFESVTDSYDPTRHSLRATASSGTLLWEKMSTAVTEKTVQPTPMPILLEYLNLNTNTVDTLITPGGLGQIVGEELKFNPENEAEGVFYVKSDGTATKVTVFSSRTMSKLVFNIPTTLTPGSYQIEVRRAYTKDNVIRTGKLPDILTVT